ncbi:MAG TPA: hypothetical protein ENN34_06820 [Deltaproteobacteria bacterium]|nr:hypothetical protein [Deltaproteobacteria bacterium]
MADTLGNRRTTVILGVLGLTLVILASVVLFFERPIKAIEMVFERPRIEAALRAYFAAEMSEDYERLFLCLAPSSHYRKTHSYEDFLAEMRSNTTKIVEYKVVDIYGLRPNHDPETYPAVERFAQAEVDITLLFTDTNARALYNYCFTFLKEGGAWFKG